jgi:hypothetical protein
MPKRQFAVNAHTRKCAASELLPVSIRQRNLEIVVDLSPNRCVKVL